VNRVLLLIPFTVGCARAQPPEDSCCASTPVTADVVSELPQLTSMQGFADAFNRAASKPRIVALFSPT
jgi:hypothetical protein